MSDRTLIALVAAMRAAQRAYFKGRGEVRAYPFQDPGASGRRRPGRPG